MLSLIIDTATKVLYIALVKDDKIIYEKQENGLKNHGSCALDYIDKALKELSLQPKAINLVIVGCGPGSYTGLRVAGTIGKVFALINNIALKEVSSLYMMQSGYDEYACSLIDARRGNYFSATFKDEILPEKLRPKAEIDAFLANKDVLFVTEDNYKADPLKIMEVAKSANVMMYTPKYLRITEAEYNLGANNDN